MVNTILIISPPWVLALLALFLYNTCKLTLQTRVELYAARTVVTMAFMLAVVATYLKLYGG